MKKRFFQLFSNVFILCTGLTNGKRFPATKYGSNELLKTAIDFFSQLIITLFKIFPSLAMPNDTISYTDRMQHASRYFTCIGASIQVVTVLSRRIIICFIVNLAPGH